MNKIYIVGMGPGFESMMTKQAIDALEASDVIVGYTVYIKLLGEKFQTKEILTTPMRQEKESFRSCLLLPPTCPFSAFPCSRNLP